MNIVSKEIKKWLNGNFYIEYIILTIVSILTVNRFHFEILCIIIRSK